jgi:hypothetical protein
MRVRVSDPALAADLGKHLRRADCDVLQMSARVLAVALRDPLPYETARLAVKLRLEDWRERNAPANAVLID